MKLSNELWPNMDRWLGWPAEQRDAFAERIASNATLANQQNHRVKAAIADWVAYRREHPPHPHWRANRAVLSREVNIFYQSRRKAS